MTTDKDLFIRQRFENEKEIWDVAESEVASPTFTLEVDNFNDSVPKDTKKGGFIYYPAGSELPVDYVSWKDTQENPPNFQNKIS